MSSASGNLDIHLSAAGRNPFCISKAGSGQTGRLHTIRQPLAVLLAFLLLGQAASAQDGRPARCLLRVGHETFIDGPCTFYPHDTDGSFSIESPYAEYFAQLSVVKPGVAEGWWNGHPSARRAHSPLGLLYRDGACWVNDAHDQVCAW